MVSEIISIDGTKVKIGVDGGKIAVVPIAAIAYANPRAGDKVSVYKDGDEVIVKKLGAVASDKSKRINKVTYILLALFLGTLGVHRFMRGQVGIGILYLFTLGLCTIGVMIDVIIAIANLNKYDGDQFTFTRNGQWD
ncbi:MAG: TM2 domain-containing protein [Candidatus Saccharimonas aalborgensis]